MSNIAQVIHARVSEHLAEIEAICVEYNYEVTPTLLLRHAAGPEFSMLITNDSLSSVVLCIAELGDIGEVIEEDEDDEEEALP